MLESDGPQRIITCPKPLEGMLVCAQMIMGLVPIAQLAIGGMYQYDCPRQPLIPIYLQVMGALSLSLNLLSLKPCGRFSKVWYFITALVFLCWFIAGNVWIYSIYEPNYNQADSSNDTYCNKTLYLFAFWTTNLSYILLGVMLFLSCCACIVVMNGWWM